MLRSLRLSTSRQYIDNSAAVRDSRGITISSAVLEISEEGTPPPRLVVSADGKMRGGRRRGAEKKESSASEED